MADPITFSAFITPVGMGIAGALIMGVVEVLKAAIPVLDAKVSGAQMAFAVSALLYILTALVLQPLTPDTALQVFAAWLTVASVAMGVKAATTHVSLLKTKALGNDPIVEDI